ncbi:MAG: peptidylprolyl isomerase [Alphaproteobacteria bacterium]
MKAASWAVLVLVAAWIGGFAPGAGPAIAEEASGGAPAAAGLPPGTVLKVGDRTLTVDELAAELGWEPGPLVQRMKEDRNFATTFAVRWYESELFARAAADDGLLAKKPGLAGAAANLSRNMIADQYVDSMLADELQPSDAEVASYYAMNKEKCRTPVRYRFARVGVQIAKNASEEEKAAAQKRMDAIEAKLVAGDSFGSVADGLSDLPGKKAGGELDWIEDGELGKEEGVDALRLIAVGNRTPPIKTRRGLEIFTLLDKEDGRQQTLDQCRPKLVTQINQEYRRAASRKRVDELARRYGASMNLDAFLDATKKATVDPANLGAKGAKTAKGSLDPEAP